MRRVPITLAFKLPLLVVAAVILTAAAGSVAAIVVGRATLRVNAMDAALDRVDVYASAVKFYVDSARTVLETTAGFPSIQRVDLVRSRAILVLENAKVFEYVMLLGPDGVVGMLEPASLERELSHRDLSFQPWYRGLRNTRKTVVSDLHISPATQRPTVIIATPVRSVGGELVGIWAGALKLAELSRLGRPPSVAGAPIGYGFVTDRRGLIIAHQARATYVENQTDVSAIPTVRAALAGERGAMDFVNPIDGDRKIGGYRSVEGLGWVATYAIPVTHAFAPLDSLTKGVAVASAVLAFLMGGAGIIVAQRIVRPLKRLTAAARTMGAGDYTGRIEATTGDEVGELARAFNQMAVGLAEKESQLRRRAEELQRADRLKSEFLANMSHELRTPLNAIIGFAELLHDGKVGRLSGDQSEYLGDILTSSRHLLQLINDVLDLAKVESGKMEFRAGPVNVARVMGEVRDILRGMAASKRITVETEIAPDLGEVVLDAGKLKQVLYNYLSNALKFTAESGRVTIRAAPEAPDCFRVEVEDTGIGINPGDMSRLFVEFQQLDAGTGKQYSGTGLGLVLTKRIVEAQGGRVGVRSEPNRGSVFYAVFPGTATRREKPDPGIVPAHPSDVAGPSILVIEDDPSDQRWIARTLVGAGYGVEVVATGAAAVERANARAFDVITLDLLLPDMGGQEVLRRIRSEGPNRATPVVVVTVVAEKGAVAGFFVHEILAKPLSGADLLGALERARLPPHTGTRILVVDDDPFALKLAERVLTSAGYHPVCHLGAPEALKALDKEAPSAIVLDLVMPGMSGWELLDHLRRRADGRKIPVIVWTEQDLTAPQRAHLMVQAQGVVSKSQGSASLLDEIRAHLRAEPAKPGAGSADGR